MAGAAVGMDIDSEHSEAVAATGTHPEAVASGRDIFKVCLNKDVVGHLLQVPAELEALQREFADWSPGPVLLASGTAVVLRPTLPCDKCPRGTGDIRPLPCLHCLRDMKGTVTEHRAADPRLVTVFLGDVDIEKQTRLVLYSILSGPDLDALIEERARIMQEQIEVLLSPTPGTGTLTVIGYNEFHCGGKAEREYWLCLDEGPLTIKANQMPLHAQNNPDKNTLCVLHVRYSNHECLEVEGAALRVTESIELRAHQDKCRPCDICRARRKCSNCKGQLDHTHDGCVVKLKCFYCTEFKWQGGYGKQILDKQCSIVEPICSQAYLCTKQLSLDDACQRHFALVVGNGEYGGKPSSSFGKLVGAVEDARAISDQLQRLGFKVHNNTPLLNQNKTELERQVLAWTQRLPENAVALVFLSGHGMELQGERYFVSVDFQIVNVLTIVAMAKERCVSLEWIHDRVYSALRQDGLIISFWDCCRENALKAAETDHIVRGAGGDSLIRNINKLKKKLAQIDYDSVMDKTASWVTVYASSPASLAFGDKFTRGYLMCALLAWWQHDEYAARSIGDKEVQDFVDKHLKDAGVKQKCVWESVGGGRNFSFKGENHSRVSLAGLADTVVDASNVHVSFGSLVPTTLTGQISGSLSDVTDEGGDQRSEEEWLLQKPPDAAKWPYKILFVGVNGDYVETQLNLNTEYRAIQAVLRGMCQGTSKTKVISMAYSTWSDVMPEIKEEKPTVLHFGCHSQKENGLELFERTMIPKDIIQFLGTWNAIARTCGIPDVRVIVVNACESHKHAQELSECVDFAIGHHDVVHDKDAIDFSEHFYDNILNRGSILDSFKMASTCSRVNGYRLYGKYDATKFFSSTTCAA